jgi:hypothetical protein
MISFRLAMRGPLLSSEQMIAQEKQKQMQMQVMNQPINQVRTQNFLLQFQCEISLRLAQPSVKAGGSRGKPRKSNAGAFGLF